MAKKLSLILLSFVMLSLAISLASAYDGYYYPGSSSSSSRNTYKETTLYENEVVSNQGYYWGNEKTTYYIKEQKTIEKNYAPVVYHPYYPSYSYPSYSNWRYKRPYNCRDYNECPRYSNTYTKPYYYAPRYDSNLGHYNWLY